MALLFNHMGLWVLVACASSFVSGLCCSFVFLANKRRRNMKRKVKEELSLDRSTFFHQEGAPSFAQRVIVFISNQSRELSLKPERTLFITGVWRIGVASLSQSIVQAGYTERLTVDGFCLSRALSCFAGMGAGALFGSVFSVELMAFAAFLGIGVGWRLPRWALAQTVKERKSNLENHVSEMLEVLALGLRSGLSFDRSFELYHSHFSTTLSKESAFAQQQWHMGLQTREEALRALAATYDSSLFSRVVENIIRSLRFGSSLADSIGASALEARVLHKANKEEEVAKAPVKMLVPTAALILPAMLILVLGPVMLDMMRGF